MASAQQSYKDEHFVSPVPEYLHCVICLNILVDAMQCVKNEHSFCKLCITHHVQNTPRCPNCNDQLTLQTLRPSRLVREMIAQLRIHCDHFGRGCLDIMTVEMRHAHIANCEFSPVKCSNDGCDLVLNRKDKNHHQMKECDFRVVECRLCREHVSYWKRMVHCYVTRKEVGEVERSLKEAKDEMSDIKQIVRPLNRELTRYMGELKDQMGGIKDEIGGIKDQMGVMKKIIAETRTVGQSMNVGLRADIVIAGGTGVNLVNPASSVEIFSWTTRQWTFLPPTTSSRWFSSLFVYQGQMVVHGGVGSDSMEALQMTQIGAGWKKLKARLPQQMLGHASAVYEDSLFMFGGRNDHEKKFNSIYQMSLVPPFLFKLVCHMPEPRAHHGAQLFGDKVVIVGGRAGHDNVPLDKVVEYNITNNTCQILPSLPFAVSEMATVAWNNNIVIIGGEDHDGDTLDTVVVYHITNGKCTMLPAMKHKRARCHAVVTGNIIVVMGGWNEEKGNLDSVENFSFNTYLWEDLPLMNERRQAAAAVLKDI